jgi:hypothetical protein
MNMHVSMVGAVDCADHALWDKIQAEHAAAKQASDLFNSSVYDPLYQELKQTAPFPELSFEIEALDGKVTRYRIDTANLHAWDDHWSPVIRRKAAAIRDAWLAHCEAHERLGLGALGEESDRLCNAQCDIESKLIAMPSPDRSALLWKLEHLFGPDAWDSDDFSPSWCAKWVNAVMEDARRLLGGQKMPFLVWLEAEKMAA